ncbi:MAG: VWA domain-containing protein [Chloroflexi bacterium]|nr:VWA domain-containing protein [Chloroflexota bacterium]
MLTIKKAFLLITVLLLLSVSTVNAQGTARVNIEDIDNGRFPVLEIYLSITDVQGFPIKNLDISNFSVSEDGRSVKNFEVTPVQNVKQPLAVVLAIDTSGSMGGRSLPTPLQNAVEAAKIFVDSLSSQDQVAVISFSSSSYMVQDFTDDRSVIRTQLDALKPDGNTTMYDGIVQAVNLLGQRSERRVLILITDGKDTGNGKFSSSDARDEVRGYGIPVYSIGFGDVDRDELEKISGLAGGTAQIKPNSSDLQSAFRTVLQILREQYLVRYTSSLPADSNQHELKITIDAQGLSVSDERSFEARLGEIKIILPFKDGDIVGGNVLLKPKVIAPADLEQLDIRLDGEILQSVLSEPFEYPWDTTTVDPGLHKFVFIVTDEAGNTGQASIDLNIEPPITVNIVTPVKDQEVGGLTKAIAEVSSLVRVARVEYMVDGVELQTLTASPYEVTINWSDYSKGPHWLEVKATDANGFSDTQKIMVQARGKDFWFLILVIGMSLAALGIPIAVWERKKAVGTTAKVESQAILRELEGPNLGKVWHLGSQDVRLGRKRDNDIQLRSTGASREQALIKYENGNHVLYNLSRENPPTVNKVEVRQKSALRSGDIIQFGKADQEIIRYEQQ